MKLNSLDQLGRDQSAYIDKVHLSGILRRRIFDLGFTPGAKIKCIRHSPSGNPTAYFIRGTMIALRNEDAAQIQIHLITEENHV